MKPGTTPHTRQKPTPVQAQVLLRALIDIRDIERNGPFETQALLNMLLQDIPPVQYDGFLDTAEETLVILLTQVKTLRNSLRKDQTKPEKETPY